MLRNHYLVEDYEMMADHLDNLMNQLLKTQECATKGDFTQRDNIIASINHSMLMLQALNAKKTQRELYESGRVQHI